MNPWDQSQPHIDASDMRAQGNVLTIFLLNPQPSANHEKTPGKSKSGTFYNSATVMKTKDRNCHRMMSMRQDA
jgi:hypothetical protein